MGEQVHEKYRIIVRYFWVDGDRYLELEVRLVKDYY